MELYLKIFKTQVVNKKSSVLFIEKFTYVFE